MIEKSKNEVKEKHKRHHSDEKEKKKKKKSSRKKERKSLENGHNSGEHLGESPRGKHDRKEKKNRKRKRENGEKGEDHDEAPKAKRKRVEGRTFTDSEGCGHDRNVQTVSQDEQKIDMNGFSKENSNELQAGVEENVARDSDAVSDAIEVGQKNTNGSNDDTKGAADTNSDNDLSELLGPASAHLLTPSEVKDLSTSARDLYLSRVTNFCSTILYTLDDLLCRLSKYQISATLEEMIISDMAKTKHLSLYKAYRETTLWRRVARTSGMATELANEVFAKDKESKKKTVEEYLKEITARYEGELEALRNKEEMGEGKVKFLLRCLKEGADIFADLKLESSEKKDDKE